MITGFNTDIEYQGITYHVQTEDKGVKTPLILSLVYDRGTILASKRSTYDDLLIGNFNETELTERLQKQHKLICAAVRAGRIEDLKRMAARDSAARAKPADEKQIDLPKQAESPIADKSPVEAKSPLNETKPKKLETAPQLNQQSETKSFVQSPVEKTAAEAIKNPPAKVEQAASEPKDAFVSKPKDAPVSKQKDELIWDVPISVVEEPIIEAVQVVEELILADEAVEILTDYIDDSDIDTRLKVKLLTNEKLKSGDRKTLSIAVKRGNQKKGLSGAQVIVKILGSSFRPLIFHSKTDDNGIATIHLQLPQFKSGRAALLIKAINEGEEVELRRVVQQS